MRIGEIERTTAETRIRVKLSLDEGGKPDISTGIGFFDHMLTAFAVHSGFGVEIECEGDLEVDGHHTVEDVGIALGLAFARAAGGREGQVRYGNFVVPMDEALASCFVDICGRGVFVFGGEFAASAIGGMDTQLVREFFRAFAYNANITLHINMLYGENDHHKCEAAFKAFAHAIKDAARLVGGGPLSTKGCL